MKLSFVKTITRDWSLLGAQIWHEVYTQEFKKQYDWGYTDVLLMGADKSIVAYRPPSEHIDGMRDMIIENINQDMDWMKNQAERSIKLTEKAVKWIEENKKSDFSELSNQDLEKILNGLIENGRSVGPSFLLMLLFPIQMEERNDFGKYKDSVEAAIHAREEIEIVAPKIDELARKIQLEVAERARINKDLSRYLSKSDCLDFLKNNTPPNMAELKKRDEHFVITVDGIVYDQVEEYAQTKGYEIIKEEFEGLSEVKGRVAYPGKTTGIVRIIKSKQYFDTFEEGDVLITGMTTPDFMPLLKKASAFVTDEGGITCHAAIVAREIKKPCIIGTKVATEVFKDGDMVEVDADNGILKIIK